MNFTASEDIEAPIEAVFEEVSNFESFERAALRRGAEVERLDGKTSGPLASWRIRFPFRGKERRLKADITSFEPPTGFRVQSASGGIDGQSVVELLALSRSRTRMTVSLDLTPKTLAARLLMQSLKLGRAKLDRKFRVRVAEFAEEIEGRRRAG